MENRSLSSHSVSNYNIERYPGFVSREKDWDAASDYMSENIGIRKEKSKRNKLTLTRGLA